MSLYIYIYIYIYIFFLDICMYIYMSKRGWESVCMWKGSDGSLYIYVQKGMGFCVHVGRKGWESVYIYIYIYMSRGDGILSTRGEKGIGVCYICSEGDGILCTCRDGMGVCIYMSRRGWDSVYMWDERDGSL